eukprot:SAG22_NODE_9847_length_566_cov_1.280514_1_plen_52_part_10
MAADHVVAPPMFGPSNPEAVAEAKTQLAVAKGGRFAPTVLGPLRCCVVCLSV